MSNGDWVGWFCFCDLWTHEQRNQSYKVLKSRGTGYKCIGYTNDRVDFLILYLFVYFSKTPQKPTTVQYSQRQIEKFFAYSILITYYTLVKQEFFMIWSGFKYLYKPTKL